MNSWNLGAKFSLLLALVWFLGSGVTVFGLSKHLNDQAEQAVEERAEILLSTMKAARNYTRYNIQPLLERSSDLKNDFMQEGIPNFAARTIFSNFQQQDPDFQDFFYKEAAPNPTNASDRVDDFETQLFSQLQSMTTAQSEILSGYRTLNGKKTFYLAQPLIMTDASCLACHGNPSDAPERLIEVYGDQNGFGWQLNDVVAAQMIYVPADTIFARGRQNLVTVTKTLLGIFGALFIIINLLLWRTVIKPLKILTNTAKNISSCSINQPQNLTLKNQALEALTTRQDEPGQLARAFDYMIHVLGRREQDLQQAIQARTKALEQEMGDRQAAQDALQTYSRTINHDLRNLVMGISSLIQGILLRSSRTDPSVAPSHGKDSAESIEIEPKALVMIQKSCDRQLQLMSSLMDVNASDIWQMALQFEAVNLSQLIKELQINYGPKLFASVATLENRVNSELPLIQADPSQLQRVFENLIDNALKHNPGGEVAISLGADICAGDRMMMRCTVADDGIGVNLEKSRELFKMNTRGQASHQTSGYGLGLYICRKIVEAHGGNIGVAISPMGGAEFWFTLPLFLGLAG
ncbi:MAG: DUF3365 domain-containing protein [Cyanobacteria bacterium P01_A01_bin.123]